MAAHGDRSFSSFRGKIDRPPNIPARETDRDELRAEPSAADTSQVGDTIRSTAIFGPVQTLNFWLSPPHLRVPVVVTAAVLWTSILSFTRGDVSRDKAP